MATVFAAQSTVDAQEKLLAGLPAKNLGPLWTVMDALVSQVPAPKSTPKVWRYEEVLPDLLTAGKIIPEEQAQRRVLMLVNPAMKAPYTTDTLYSGLQLVNPGETAPAHKHVAFALRYIIEGNRGFTAVDGKKMYMDKGDMILTPSWTFHDHGHEGEGPMIWLDGLDLPLFQGIPVNFAQPYHEKRFPSEVVPGNNSMHFPWGPVKAALDADPATQAVYDYKKQDGSDISLTLAAKAERVKVGSTTRPNRETCSFVFHCPEGRGSTHVLSADGSETTLEWKQNDTFAIPAWSRIAHTAIGDGDAYLFSFSEKPLLQSLGMYRQE